MFVIQITTVHKIAATLFIGVLRIVKLTVECSIFMKPSSPFVNLVETNWCCEI